MASVRVAVRVRPMNKREKDLSAKCIIKMDGAKTSIANPKLSEGAAGDPSRDSLKTFTYDFSYDSADSGSSGFVTQEKVFRDLGRDVLKAAFEGYNACVLAYGQTGSGKSYTMMGNPGDAGLIPRICQGLFGRIDDAARRDEASFRTEVSYLEIYNERVRDLLRRKSAQTCNLRVREHPKDGPYVQDLSKHLVQNYSDVEELMEAGNTKRTTASTGMNDTSSRSHAIFTVNFTQAKFDAEMPSETLSKIHLVDLAGSERADATGAAGVRLKEGANINKSLVTLGNVISALADLCADADGSQKRKSLFVPYRDSVLTWLLKDSLGGNSKTIMIATVSPADVNYGETLSTLRYANRAKNIINKPTVNEDANVKLIRELRAEIARLKALLLRGNQVAVLDSPTALSMEEKLHRSEARVLELTKEWTNKWSETQNILKEETLALRKEGTGVVLDSELPHLLAIDDDLLSTGIILYHLKEGPTYVGREDGAGEQDIVVHGADVESQHCVFDNSGGTVTLVPLAAALCCVNGRRVATPTRLNQGAVVLLGRTNMFRFNHPKEAAKLREKRKSGLSSTLGLSASDLSKSCDNLSAVMLYNAGRELECRQREELDRLELTRQQIKQMEAKQRSEKAKLQRLRREVESRRKESEEARQRILRQEESLRRRSRDMESRLRDFLEEKRRFDLLRQADQELPGPEEELRREPRQPERLEAAQLSHKKGSAAAVTFFSSEEEEEEEKKQPPAPISSPGLDNLPDHPNSPGLDNLFDHPNSPGLAEKLRVQRLQEDKGEEIWHKKQQIHTGHLVPDTVPLSDHRINIEEEVERRRLQRFNLDTSSPAMDPEPSRHQCGSGVAEPPPLCAGEGSVRVNIPRYVLRGQGKDEHFEFEVKMSVKDETWTVFRRYSRFRELHKSLKSKYPQLAILDFPPKKLFGNKDEKMVAERRNQLERYLRSVFEVMSASSGSPLRQDDERAFPVSKRSVCELSPFFKKGVFESGRHGTG
ncbi:kinesin-like protein KIF16B isoform X2 [Syngnathus acus]|uniref:kinesin-like protein KIF16B isoform X2 n=1 Tax=Syngnathus acus TaxID=161584 RepID=UPI001885D289|nr:kinesin-like protein KIF16B isoform X2 [Syngnathus acus]